MPAAKITDGQDLGIAAICKHSLLYTKRLLLLDLQHFDVWARTAWTEHSLPTSAFSLSAYQQHVGRSHAKFQSSGKHSGRDQATRQRVMLECTPVHQNRKSCTA